MSENGRVRGGSPEAMPDAMEDGGERCCNYTGGTLNEQYNTAQYTGGLTSYRTHGTHNNPRTLKISRIIYSVMRNYFVTFEGMNFQIYFL